MASLLKNSVGIGPYASSILEVNGFPCRGGGRKKSHMSLILEFQSFQSIQTVHRISPRYENKNPSMMTGKRQALICIIFAVMPHPALGIEGAVVDRLGNLS